jgi:DNA-binding CsgD family transcriptional regulator/tetratricopeptide (TPR) repeat protein
MVVMRQVPMIGRVAELSRLVEFAQLAAAGRGSAVCVEGAPGIGKTTLLDALAAEATRLGIRVRRAAAQESTQRLPFAVLAGCLGIDDCPPGSRIASIAGLLRGEHGLGQSAPASLEFASAEAMIAAIEEWCAAAPVLLLLDDVHRIDAASRRALHRIGPALGQLPLLLVGARRPAGAGGQHPPLFGAGRPTGMLRLGPLTEPEVEEFVARMAGGCPGRRLRASIAPAAGNPLHLTEQLALFSHRPGLRVVAGIVELAGPPDPPPDPLSRSPSGQLSGPPSGQLPGSLPGSILRRVASLSIPAQQVLRVAAVLGAEFGLADLAAVLGCGAAELLPAVREGMDAGLLGGLNGRFTFGPDVVRDTLVDALPAPGREALHQAAARALMTTGARVERVAVHLLAGGALQPDAVRWLLASMDPLIARAPEFAAELLRRALAAASTDAAPVLGRYAEALRFGYVRALLMAGLPAEAEQTARTGPTGDGTAEPVALRWLLAQACLQQGRPDTALAEAQRALAGPDVPAGAAARLHGISAQSLFLLGRLAEAEAAAGLALAAGVHRLGAGRVGAPPRSPGYVPHRHPAEALAETDQALSALTVDGLLPDQRTALLLTRGCCLEDLDRLDEADREFEQGRQICERGDTTFLVWFHVSRARLWFFEGRWDDALAEIAAGREPGDPLGLAPALDSLAAMVAVHRGEPATVPARSGGTAARCFDHLRRWVGALAAEAEGHPDRALDVLADSWDQGRSSLPPALPHRLCPDLVRLAVMQGDLPRARQVAAGIGRFAEQRRTPSARGTAELCRGLAESDPGALLDAAESFRIAGRPLFRAYAQENAGVVLAQAGDHAAAGAALQTALELYGQLGACWDAGRAERRARQAGVSSSAFGLPSRPRAGWAALTDTERTVAALVAEGRSNPDIATRLFRSRRTVQWHVTSILTKLDLSSRAELAAAVSCHRLTVTG